MQVFSLMFIVVAPNVPHTPEEPNEVNEVL